MTSRTSYSLLFMLINECSKRDKCSQTKSRAFSLARHFETYKDRRSPHDVPSPIVILPTQEQIISFSRKK